MKLVLVPTPIGNLEDITLRAINVLKSCDCIYAEDTRTTGHLLKHLGIQKPLAAFHIHNEHQAVQKVIEKIKASNTVCYVSDAGTPGLSDPGFLLVRNALEAGIAVECLPGATAAIPALVVSGLPMDRFCFEGFLPHKKGRKTRLNELKNENRTMIFYESPHRILKSLEQFIEIFGTERKAAISRELSKLFEENIRGTLAELLNHFKNKTIKGEFVVIVEGIKG
jgi:16S rRNA (cytidine1402-2'-O)-methyltransferase